MPDVPPKQPVTGVNSVRIDAGEAFHAFHNARAQEYQHEPETIDPSEFAQSTAALAVRGASHNTGGDSFPVLKAFQDYLDSERQRSSRRMTILSCVFALAIVALIIGFLLLFMRTQERQDILLKAIIEQARQQPIANTPQPNLNTAQPNMGEIRKETERVVQEAVIQAKEEQTQTFALALAEYTNTIAKMKAEYTNTVASMTAENEKLKSAILSATKTANTQTNNAAGKAANATLPAQPVELKIPHYPTPPPPVGFSRNLIEIDNPNGGQPVAWRVYTPAL